LQHFATFFHATFFQKYAIKKCKLEKVSKEFFSCESLFIVRVGSITDSAAHLVFMGVKMACKGKKRK
jgi:hypothetical protein